MNNVYFDNRDDKKEIFNIIQNYLNEREREEFLNWCCKQVNSPLSSVLRPGQNSTWHPKEVFWQLMNLAFMHGLDLKVAIDKMLEMARQK